MRTLFLTILALSFFQGTVFAQEDNRREQNIDKMRSIMLENIQKRKSILDTLESCVRSAASRDDFKNCRESHKNSMDGLRSQRKDMKQQFRQERKQRRQDRRMEREQMN